MASFRRLRRRVAYLEIDQVKRRELRDGVREGVDLQVGEPAVLQEKDHSPHGSMGGRITDQPLNRDGK
jgi:hypothetical protein